MSPIERHILFKIPNKSPHVIEFTAREGISSTFEVDVKFSHKEKIDFDDVVGKEALLTIPGVTIRHFHGIINQFVQVGSSGGQYHYRATMVPMLWLLSLRKDCRIFQDKDVKEIVSELLKAGGITTDNFKFRTQSKYEKRDYCVQYRESDLNFISRLLEEEGIFYFFEHKENDQGDIQHCLVFGDSKVNYQQVPGGKENAAETEIKFRPPDTKGHQEDTIQEIYFSRQIRPGKVTLSDFNFQKPSLKLMKSEESSDSFKELEVHDYSGEYSEEQRGAALAKIRLEEERAFMDKAEGKSDCPNLIPGFAFKLTPHKSEIFKEGYLVAEIIHTGEQKQADSGPAAGGGSSYSNRFVCIPSSVTIRPDRNTPKPVVEGVQSAIVVGPKGEEIYTDEYGRVKVQFHWDRLGKKDEKSSCFIRVSQVWAGAGWGAMHIPRIGHEVIVDFVEGDPDRPIITGQVYHKENTPPYALPDDMTKSTLKSSSSPEGKGFNEIRFEDKKDKEEVYIHAQKDMNLAVENDRSETIGNDSHLTVKRDKREKVDSDKHVMIGQDEIVKIGRDHNLKIAGKEAIEITGSHSFAVCGDVIEIFDKTHSEEVKKDYYLKAKNVVIEAMTGLTINVGGNFITIDSAGVTIKGTKVNINSGGSALSGSPGSLVAPAAPLEAVISGTSAAGKISAAGDAVAKEAAEMSPAQAVAFKADRHKEPAGEKAKEEAKEKAWIEIEMVGEDDKPITGEKYIITLPDGKVATGTTDSDGKAKVTGIDPDGKCKVTFSNLDKDAWEKI